MLRWPLSRVARARQFCPLPKRRLYWVNPAHASCCLDGPTRSNNSDIPQGLKQEKNCAWQVIPGKKFLWFSSKAKTHLSSEVCSSQEDIFTMNISIQGFWMDILYTAAASKSAQIKIDRQASFWFTKIALFPRKFQISLHYFLDGENFILHKFVAFIV